MLKMRCWKLGLAGLAAGMFFALTAPAEASFTLTIKDMSGPPGTTIFTSTIAGSSINANFTYVAPASRQGPGGTYVFNLTGKTNSASLIPGSTSRAIVSVAGTVKVTGNITKATNTFTVTATDNSFFAPGIAGQTAFLYADQDVKGISKGFSIRTQGQYTDAVHTSSSPVNTTQLTTRWSASQTLPSNKQTPDVFFVRGSNKFSLASLNFDINYGGKINGGHSSSGPVVLDFYADAVVDMPEPAAIIIALIGIPLVFFVALRRAPRRAPVAA